MNANKIKAVIDTQIFLRAAINRQSLPGKLVFDLRDRYILVTSPQMMAEVTNVLSRPALRTKFKTLTDATLNGILTRIADAEIVEVTDVEAVSRDPKDDIFLACARASGANYVVSEDKDLLVLNPYKGIPIIDALGFLHVLQQDQS